MQKRALKFIQDFVELIPLRQLRVRLEELDDFFNHFKIFGDTLTNARALDFHHNFASVTQNGAMYLTQRRSSKRFGLEA